MQEDKKRTKGSSVMRGLGAALLMMLPALVFAQDAPPPPNKGDVSWLMTSTVLVILMTSGSAIWVTGTVCVGTQIAGSVPAGHRKGATHGTAPANTSRGV